MYKSLLFLFFLAFFSNTNAQNDQALLDEIKSIENGLLERLQIKGEEEKKYNILERMEHYKVPGMSIAIVKDGVIHWAKGYGIANTETGALVDENTLFQAGSISKPIAALAALKLYENGDLDLQKNVNEYLKDWQIPENEFTTTEKVTIERLLTHTAGTTVHGFPGYDQTDSFPSDIEVLSGEGNTGAVSVDVVPGSIWRYSGGGYTVMEKAVEDISGQSFDAYLSEHILTPMSMTNSTYEQPVSKKWQSNISAAYNGNGEITEGWWHNYPEQAAAGLWTTPSDLAHYCMEIQEILKGKENGVLKKSTVDLMLTKHKDRWGLGPSLRSEQDSLMFGHGGKNEGFTNNMIAFAHQGHAAIIMTNADNGGRLIGEIENAIAAAYDWPIGGRRIIEIISLPEAQLNNYLGDYRLVGQGLVVSFKLVEGMLTANTPIGTLKLSPMEGKKFIDLGTGTGFRFQVEDEVVKGFEVNNGMKFVKVVE